MSTLVIIGIIVAYIVIGRVYAQIRINIDGFYPDWRNEEIFWHMVLWPITLPYWMLTLLIEWIDDNYY